jgi:hypothetical protein
LNELRIIGSCANVTGTCDSRSGSSGCAIHGGDYRVLDIADSSYDWVVLVEQALSKLGVLATLILTSKVLDIFARAERSTFSGYDDTANSVSRSAVRSASSSSWPIFSLTALSTSGRLSVIVAKPSDLS